MSVAQMPCDPQQGRPIGCLDFKNWLGRGAHADKAAGVELEPVAVCQMMRPGQVEQKAFAGVRDKPDAAPVPVNVGESHGVERSLWRPMSRRMDLYRPVHRRLIKKVALSHRQDRRGFADQMHAIGSHLVGFRIDLDVWCRGIVDHAGLVDRTDVARR